MKTVIAIPLQNGQLCSHFGHCEQFSILEVEKNSIINEILITPPPHEPGLLPGWLAEKGVNEIIAGGIGQRAITLFTAQNIKVNVGAEPKSPVELVTDWINRNLVTGTNACTH
jgi:predicted Fe-Mo cluster-binding NifX family protein